MIARILVLLCALPLVGSAQSIPYATLKTAQDCMEELRRMEGVTAELKLDHSDPGDTRDFLLFLETPKGRSEIKLLQDGSFRLPPVPSEEQDRSRVVHSLEKGALKVTCWLDVKSPLPRGREKEASVEEICSRVVDAFRKIDHVWDALGVALPGFRDFQMAIVGVACRREAPSLGQVVLKNGEATVATADLSQTGTVYWMFDQVDPKTHRIAWETKDGEPPPLYMVFKTGKEAEGMKGAIFIRKSK